MDLKIILGRLFVILGALLLVAGFTVHSIQQARLFGYNINLVWGTVLLVLGGAFSFKRHPA